MGAMRRIPSSPESVTQYHKDIPENVSKAEKQGRKGQFLS